VAMKKSWNRLWFILMALACPLHPVKGATWTTNTPMNYAVYQHTATLLTDGRILVAGGRNNTAYFTNAEIFDPGSDIWTNTGALKLARAGHTATLLPNGQVLVAGGTNATPPALASAELYDPIAGVWTNANAMNFGRATATATLMLDGRVLVAGGTDGSNALNSAEIYDPATSQWTLTSPLNQGRSRHTATLLTNGTVLIAGGYDGSNTLVSAELFDPATGLWTLVNQMNGSREYHSAILMMDGRVLVAGGSGTNAVSKKAEIFDPAGETWIVTGSLNFNRAQHAASMLPNGMVLITGGSSAYAEQYDPASGTWTTNTVPMNFARTQHTATLLPGGRILVAGGDVSSQASRSAETYSSTNGFWTTKAVANAGVDCMTLLSDGRALATGGAWEFYVTNMYGQTKVFEGLSNAQTYDFTTGVWTGISPMNLARYGHTMTLLPDGKVMVAGGYFHLTNGMFQTGKIYATNSELFDPVTGTWSISGSLNYPRFGHTATLLPNGKVLVIGGGPTNAELFDPTTERWTIAAYLTNNLTFGYTATLLPNGKVLVAGNDEVAPASAYTEIYDPALDRWTMASNMNVGRYSHTATLLPNGKVLVTGGNTASSTIANVESYDYISGKWTIAQPMQVARYGHKAILLPDGRVMVAGGIYSDFFTRPFNPMDLTAEIFDPITGTWTYTGSMTMPQGIHNNAGVLLPDGKFLISAGTNGETSTNVITEIFDPEIGYTNTAQPQISFVNSPLNLGSSLVVTGSAFRGFTESSGGNSSQGSTSDHPLLELYSLHNGQSTFLPLSSWGTNSLTTLPVNGFPPGYAMATVFANGIQSTSSIVQIGVGVPALYNLQKLTNGSFQFNLNYYAGAAFTVQRTTNDVSQPLNYWQTLGVMSEVSPGLYQFIDSTAKKYSNSFYTAHFP